MNTMVYYLPKPAIISYFIKIALWKKLDTLKTIVEKIIVHIVEYKRPNHIRT